MSMKIIEITGKIRLITGLHIGVGNDEIHIGGIDSAVIKDAYGNPYIPGSSLKGKMRSLLELSSGETTGGPSTRKDFPDSIIPVMFGDLTKTEISRVLFRDAFLNEESKKRLAEDSILPTEEKSENSIDRLKGMAISPRKIERVIPNMVFDFEIVVRLFDTDDEQKFKKIIQKGLYLIEHDALGGNGSRGYGKVKFENVTWAGDALVVEYLE